MNEQENSYLMDLVNQAAKGLGIDTGANAAKTVGKLVKSSVSPSAQTPTAPPASSVPGTKVFGLSPGVAAIATIGVGLVVTLLLVRRGK